jgi:hypothetical protein
MRLAFILLFALPTLARAENLTIRETVVIGTPPPKPIAAPAELTKQEMINYDTPDPTSGWRIVAIRPVSPVTLYHRNAVVTHYYSLSGEPIRENEKAAADGGYIQETKSEP